MATVKKTYLELRMQNQMELDQEQLEYENQQNKLQLQADLLATKQKVNTLKKELQLLLLKQSLSSADILAKKNEITEFESGYKELQKLIKELFEE